MTMVGLPAMCAGQMLGDDASLDIGRAAGRVVDDHGDGLALVELGTRGVCEDRGGRSATTTASPFRVIDLISLANE